MIFMYCIFIYIWYKYIHQVFQTYKNISDVLLIKIHKKNVHKIKI